MRPKRGGSLRHGHHRGVGVGGSHRRRRARTLPLLAALVLTVFTVFTYVHFDRAGGLGDAEDLVVQEVRAVEDQVMKLFQSGEKGRGSSRGEGSGHVEAALVSTTKDKGNGPRPGRREKKRRRRRSGGGKSWDDFGRECFRDVFKFRNPLTSNTLDSDRADSDHGGRSHAHGDANLLRPSHESWISHGDTRYASNSNLEADATNGTVVYAAWQCSDTHEGAKDQFVQLAVSHNQGRRWKNLPVRLNYNRRNKAGFLPVWSPVLHSRRNGELYVFYAQSRHNCRLRGRTDWFTAGGDVYYVKSRDGGQTLDPSGPQLAFKFQDAPLVLTGNLVVARRGKQEVWALPCNQEVTQSTCLRPGEAARAYSGPGVLVSRDQGKTWNFTVSLRRDFEANTAAGRPRVRQANTTQAKAGFGIRDGALVSADQSGSSQMLQLFRSARGRVYAGKSSDYGGHWKEPEVADLPNPNAKIAALRQRDGLLVAAFNNATRRGRQGNLYVAACFDLDGTSWDNVARLEKAPRTTFSQPAMAQVMDQDNRRPGATLVAYSVSERVFGHLHSGVMQSRGIKVASVNLATPRLHVMRGKEGVTFRGGRVVLDPSGPNYPCLSLHHPSLRAVFKSPLTDRAEVRATVGIQLKVSPKQAKQRGQDLYSGLGGDDYGEIFFNADSNITSRLVSLRACKNEQSCRDSKLQRDSFALATIYGVFSTRAVVDEFSSPILVSLRILLSDGEGKQRAVNVHVDAEKSNGWLRAMQEFRFLILRRELEEEEEAEEPRGIAEGEGEGAAGNAPTHAYRLEVLFGEHRVTDFEWTGKMPSHLTFGCGRAACSPEKKGLCGASITARTQWNFKDIRLDTQLNKCLG